MKELLKNKILLAPMAGITDAVFRRLCREQGAGMVYTEMVSAKGLCHENFNTKELLASSDAPPAAVQIFGSEKESMARVCASEFVSRFDVIDINMGCPSPKITGNGDGAALMRDIKKASGIIEACVKAADRPISVKFRKGWDENSINAVEFAKMCEDSGASMIAVHGRTRSQQYSGNADWDIIAEVKKTVEIPVIGNGDIYMPEDAADMLKYTGCDAVMVARGARGNPWIFRNIHDYLLYGRYKKVSGIEKRDMALRHLELMAESKGERSAVLEMRKHFAWYLSGLRDAAPLRVEFYKETTVEGIKRLAFEKWPDDEC